MVRDRRSPRLGLAMVPRTINVASERSQFAPGLCRWQWGRAVSYDERHHGQGARFPPPPRARSPRRGRPRAPRPHARGDHPQWLGRHRGAGYRASLATRGASRGRPHGPRRQLPLAPGGDAALDRDPRRPPGPSRHRRSRRCAARLEPCPPPRQTVTHDRPPPADPLSAEEERAVDTIIAPVTDPVLAASVRRLVTKDLIARRRRAAVPPPGENTHESPHVVHRPRARPGSPPPASCWPSAAAQPRPPPQPPSPAAPRSRSRPPAVKRPSARRPDGQRLLAFLQGPDGGARGSAPGRGLRAAPGDQG